MAYEKTVWVNGQAPALDADHLNKMEQGIADAVSVTPQTLSAEQQAQARGNINSAPGGFGLGANGFPYPYTIVTGDTVDNLSRSGLYWYVDSSKPFYADDYNSGAVGLLLHLNGDTRNVLSARQIFFPPHPVNGVGANCRVEREKNADGAWSPVEFVNPPLALGIEYRTTERYLGKPVYTQVFKAFDSLTKGGQVYDAPILNTSQVISCTGESGNWNLPSDVIGGEVAGNFIHIGTQRGSTVVNVYAITNRETWSAPVYVTLKYTKTTD